jgi:hypothetical protein
MSAWIHFPWLGLQPEVGCFKTAVNLYVP